MLLAFLILLALLAIALGTWCAFAGAIALAIGEAWHEVGTPAQVRIAAVTVICIGLVLFTAGTTGGARLIA